MNGSSFIKSLVGLKFYNWIQRLFWKVKYRQPTGLNYKVTSPFYDKPYPINNKFGYRILVGDIVIVHPTEKSTARHPLEAKVILRRINWVDNGSYELCTHVEGGYSAVINEYLFNRLEFKNPHNTTT